MVRSKAAAGLNEIKLVRLCKSPLNLETFSAFKKLNRISQSYRWELMTYYMAKLMVIKFYNRIYYMQKNWGPALVV